MFQHEYQWDTKHRLVIKGFANKAELREAAREVTRANVYLETLDGTDPPDGCFEALPLDRRYRARVTVRNGYLEHAK